MGLSNAQKQAVHRARLRARGLTQIQAWVTPDQARAIRAILAGEAIAAPMPITRTPRRKKKKLTAAESERLQVTERNRAILTQYRADIERMEAERLPRSQICRWLEERGADFGGKAIELNSMLGPRAFV
jgi:hypothetical protein